jgi:hypothetical protein
LTREDACNLDDKLPNKQLFVVGMVDDYFSEIVEFLSAGMDAFDMTIAHNKKLVVKETNYQLIVGNLYKLGENGILRWCVLKHERSIILEEAHDWIVGGHYIGRETTPNILCVGLWWPMLHKYVNEYCQSCDVCRRVGKPSRREEMLLNS